MKKAAGLHSDRLRPDRDNPREVAFIAQWDQENVYADVLERLFEVPCSIDDPDMFARNGTNGPYKLPLGRTTERDRIVVATVLQWLGSNVGLSYVRECLRRCNYEIKFPKD
jgi:hypothetical protein